MSDYADFLAAVSAEADGMAISFNGNRDELAKLMRICYLAGCGGRESVELLQGLFPPPRTKSTPLPEFLSQVWDDHNRREKEIAKQLGREVGRETV